MFTGKSAQQAADEAVRHLEKHWHGSSEHGDGGIICISPSIETNDTRQRRWGFAFNTLGMSWAAIDGADEKPCLRFGLRQGDSEEEPLSN